MKKKERIFVKLVLIFFFFCYLDGIYEVHIVCEDLEVGPCIS